MTITKSGIIFISFPSETLLYIAISEEDNRQDGQCPSESESCLWKNSYPSMVNIDESKKNITNILYPVFCI